MTLTGVKHKLSSSYHPQTNGASEWTNKTVNQCLRFHVERNQTGWVRALPLIHFQMMNTVNKSTGYMPFKLCFGHSPRVLPPVFNPPAKTSQEYISAKGIMDNLLKDVRDARDNLMLAKITQVYHADERQSHAQHPQQVQRL